MNVAQGTQKSNQRLTALEQRKIGASGTVVGAVTEHLQDNIGAAENLSAAGDDLCTLGLVIRVGIACRNARAGFDHDFHAGLGEIRNHTRHQGHTPLSRKDFAGNTDNHLPTSVRDPIIGQQLKRSILRSGPGKSSVEDVMIPEDTFRIVS